LSFLSLSIRFRKTNEYAKVLLLANVSQLFLERIGDCTRFHKTDAAMRRDKRLASAALLALAAFALSACGADDSTSTGTSSSPGVTANDAAHAEDAAPHAATLSAALPDASAPLAANPAAASDPITQNMQASLAADSQQVAPVMRYAPGDNASNN
jgi:hypothetical protein